MITKCEYMPPAGIKKKGDGKVKICLNRYWVVLPFWFKTRNAMTLLKVFLDDTSTSCSKFWWVANRWLRNSAELYSVFHRFRQAKFAYSGSIFNLSQFLPLSQLPQKMELASKVVKVDSKIIISLSKILIRETHCMNTIGWLWIKLENPYIRQSFKDWFESKAVFIIPRLHFILFYEPPKTCGLEPLV